MSLILSGSDGLSDVDGSAATPAIRGTDANTGIFFPAADTVGVATGGSERVRVDSSGNVGIGTTSPAFKLEVVGGTNNGIHIKDAATATVFGGLFTQASAFALIARSNHALTLGTNDTERMRIDSSGNVGIGVTPNASVKLQVKTATNQNLAVVSSSFVAGGVGLAAVNDAYNAYTALDIQGSSVQFGTGGNERMRIDSSGRVLVNSTSDVGGNNPVFSANAGAATFSNIMEARWTGTGSIYHLLVRNANGLIGGVQSSGSTTAFLTSSDYRLKEDISPITGALAKVAQLKPVTYKWKVDGSDGEGFIAHELAEVCPIAVHGEKDELNEDGSIKSQSVDTSFLVATLTAAIQEQQALIQSLTARITALEKP